MRQSRWNGVFGIVLVGLAACSAEKPAESARPALVVQPGGGAEAALSAYAGEVRAREESPLSFRVGGNLIRRNVDAGARVQKGEVLALLDAGDFALQAQAAKAQLAAADADLVRARGDRDRYAKLVGDKLISQSAYDAQVAAYKAAEGQARAARAQMDVMQNQEGYSQLRAPRDGVIASRQAEAGQVVAAGQTVFTLAADGGREVAIGLPENRIRDFSVGQPVMIELWNAPGQRLAGAIREIAPAADAQTRTYAARVSLVGEAIQQVELGQSARVYVQENGTQAALKLPLSAVQRGEDGKTSVWVVDPATGKVRAQAVQLGRYGESSVPVLGGLKATDWVVAAGGHLLREGQAVTPVDRSNRPLKLAAGGGAAAIATRSE
ncbi:membrane fusion protein, multidrug efflux system [Pseudoxanthomonas sp. CF385]|uniref:efflux RND transporter periplasmic adaptor subunit n=1 Tax=Pseudoxanthomonas sp. CF385 TaxID=1881042 RepID=UPI000888BCED|nr:efflux RND transporter periplasmic adaptor subunit [Pseudoxanthomonas sp. CF385]SDQ33646.1 membrane fusion protein, multidrug efflux system [Pseudoxanthomonas sp. CF385]